MSVCLLIRIMNEQLHDVYRSVVEVYDNYNMNSGMEKWFHDKRMPCNLVGYATKLQNKYAIRQYADYSICRSVRRLNFIVLLSPLVLTCHHI